MPAYGEFDPQPTAIHSCPDFLNPAAIFRRSFFRRFRSPGSQRWQNSHSLPLAQVFWNSNAQGLQAPHACSTEPRLGTGCAPKSNDTASGNPVEVAANTLVTSAEPGVELAAVEHDALPDCSPLSLAPSPNSRSRRAAAALIVAAGLSSFSSGSIMNCDKRMTGGSLTLPSLCGRHTAHAFPSGACRQPSLERCLLRGVGKALSVGVAMAKGSSRS